MQVFGPAQSVGLSCLTVMEAILQYAPLLEPPQQIRAEDTSQVT